MVLAAWLDMPNSTSQWSPLSWLLPHALRFPVIKWATGRRPGISCSRPASRDRPDRVGSSVAAPSSPLLVTSMSTNVDHALRIGACYLDHTNPASIRGRHPGLSNRVNQSNQTQRRNDRNPKAQTAMRSESRNHVQSENTLIRCAMSRSRLWTDTLSLS